MANPKTLKMPDTTCLHKKIVIKHRSGLHQILGDTSQLPNGNIMDATFLPAVQFGDHVAPASLVTVKDRYVIYHELMDAPATGKLGEFHPEQR